MNITNVTWDNVVICFAVLLCAMTAYNTYATARKNRREEEERKNQPSKAATKDILNRLEDHDNKLANDKNRLDNLERTVNEVRADTKDMHAAQEALCYGVQSLLEHALHNGNDDEMQSASKELNRYLRSRKFSHEEQ